MKKRKTGSKPADFSRVKKKVGKAAPAPSNATKTQFKYRAIHVPTQNLKEGVGNGTAAEQVEQLHTQLSKLAHHNSTVRKDALLSIHHLLSSYPFLISLELSTLLTRTLSTLTDTDKPVRTALHTLLAALLPRLPTPTFQPCVHLYLTHTCSGLCSLNPSIRHTSLNFLSLLLTDQPGIATVGFGAVLAALDGMLRDRVGRGSVGVGGAAGRGGGGGGGAGAECERKDGKGGGGRAEKEARSGVAAEVQATLQFRVLLLQCIQRFVALLSVADSTTDRALKTEEDEQELSNSLTSSILSLSEPPSFASYAAALHAAVAEPSSAAAAKADPSEPPSLAQLTVARPTPLKYVRRGGSSASGKPTKKATISSIDDTQLLASLDSHAPALLPAMASAATAAAAASASSSPASAFSAAVSLAAFVQSSVPLLVEYWLEALGGDEAAAQQSALTTDSYQCAEACVSIFHTYSTLPSSSGASLQPFFALLSAHVFLRFPLVPTSTAVSAADLDTIAAINVHICHLIASFVPPPTAPSNDSSEHAGELTEQTSHSELNKRLRQAEEATMVGEWTSEMLDFIGQSLFQSSSATQAAVAMNGSGKRKKRKKRGDSTTALLSPSHVVELLPIIRQLVDRLPSSQRHWLLDAFTTYYTSLHALSPAKLQCVSLIAALLQPPTGTLCLSLGVGHAWLRSLPSLLVSSLRCRPAVIRLLQFVMRCWHNPHGLDLSELVEHCQAFYCEQLLSVSVELQMVALSLLPYASTLPTALLSAFAAMFNADGVDGGVSCMLLEVVATHRQRIGISAYVSFLLSCLSAERSEGDQTTQKPHCCHQRVELVLVRLRELAVDAVMLQQLLPPSSLPRSPAEILVLLLSPTLQSLISAATAATQQSGALFLAPLTLIAVIRCLCQQVRQSTRSTASAQHLPPSLATPLAALLATTLLPPSPASTPAARPSLASPPIAAVLSLLCVAPALLPSVLSQLLALLDADAGAAACDGGWLCDVLLVLLHGGGLRRWLVVGEAARLMRQAVQWLQHAGGVDRSKLQAIDTLLLG